MEENLTELTNDSESEKERIAEQSEIDEALKSFEVSEAEAEAKAEAEVEEEPKKRRWVLNVFLVAIIALGVFLMFRIMSEFNETHKSLKDILRGTDALFAILTFASLFIILFAETMKYSVIFRAVTGKFHPIISMKTMLLGKYYDNITPFSTGGQPMQIYYLCKKGFYGGISGAIIMIKYFANTFIWVIIAGLLMAFNADALDTLVGGGVALKVFAWIGWGINMLVPTSVVLFVALPKFAGALAKGVVHVGWKFKIVKDKEKALSKATKVVSDFKASFAIMVKRPKMLALLVFLCALEISLTFAFPYFVVKTFTGGELGIAETGIGTVLTVMALNAYTAFAVSFVPTPGNSGVWEGASSLAFRAIASSAWVLFTWRFFVYYIYIIIGFGITIYEFVLNISRKRRAKKGGRRNL